MALINQEKPGFWPKWRENRLFALLLAILIVYLIVFLAFQIKNAALLSGSIGKAPAERRTISFDGVGKVVGSPDIATVDIGMTTQDKEVQVALKSNNEKMNKLIDLIKKIGIADADVQTSRFNVYPTYDYSNSKQTIVGYSADQAVTVKIRDLEKVSSVLDAAGSVGANQVSGLNFTIDKSDALQNSAREKAIADAMSKASALGKELGVKFVKIVGFSESGNTPPSPYYAYDKAAMGGAASSAPAVQTGSLDITSNVTLTFEIK